MKRILISLAVISVLCVYGEAFAQKAGLADKKSAAVIAAHNWLALVDRGNYGESWEEAASYFRNAVGREQWSASVAAVREPLGSVESRALVSSTYRTSLPGAPDGEYVVITFSTSFAGKESAVETITPMLDRDGRWRVSGYFIK